MKREKAAFLLVGRVNIILWFFGLHERSKLILVEIFIPRARKGSESIAHEAEGP